MSHTSSQAGLASFERLAVPVPLSIAAQRTTAFVEANSPAPDMIASVPFSEDVRVNGVLRKETV